MSQRNRARLDRWPRAGAKVYGLGDPTRTSRDALEQQGNDVLPSCRDCEEGGQEQGLLNEGDELIGQDDGRAELADRLHGAGESEFSPGHGNLSFLQKDPPSRQARWPSSFGNPAIPANSGSVALRPPIARGLPFSGGDLPAKWFHLLKT